LELTRSTDHGRGKSSTESSTQTHPHIKAFIPPSDLQFSLGPYGARQAVSKLGRMRVLRLINDFLQGAVNPNIICLYLAENMVRAKRFVLARGHVKKKIGTSPL